MLCVSLRPSNTVRGVILFLMTVVPLAGLAVTSPPPAPAARITQPIVESRRSVLMGHLVPALRESVDLGEAEPGVRADRLTLVLHASAAQDSALEQFLRNVQTAGHKDFHRWLTPQAFAQRFGVAASDLAKLRSWIESKGLHVDEMPAGGRSIILSGTVTQINQAFGVHIHRYQWRGERHLAASTNPTIPSALAPVVSGFASLHDFHHRPAVVPNLALPDFTSGGINYLAPGDFAVIYDLSAAYAQAITGNGRSIAVLGRTSVNVSDLTNFRGFSGLTANTPQVINNGPAPSIVPGDELESDLDLEWSAAVAPAATVKFITSASTALADGIDLSAQYAVSNNVADIISVSYSACESPSDVSAGVPYFHQLWQQAAAQGISVFVASGDWGAAGCDSTPGETIATKGLGVNLLCTSPYSTCVGGTQFSADLGAQASYWSASNSATSSSALGYISESVWNQSGTNLNASGGGASIYFAKPAWQYATGVPGDGRRDVPDVALTASSAHDPYLVYTSDGYSASTLVSVGGTSAATPAMAGMIALVAQKQGTRLGNVNPVLYGLSDLQVRGGAAVFHRIISGNNSVPGQTGFSASPADPSYNQASGLGSVDGGVLLSSWTSFAVSTAALVPATVLVPATAFVGTATLTVPAGIAWSASVSTPSALWLSVTPASGMGPAQLSYLTQPNAGSARSGTITINGLTLAVSQAGATGSAHLTASPATLAFGSSPVGTPSARQRVFVGNDGSTPLSLSTLGVIGGQATDFSTSGSCSIALTLGTGTSCYIDVTFSPAAIGARVATLSVGSSGGSVSASLSGTGTVATSHAASGDVPMPPWASALLALGLMGVLGYRKKASSTCAR